MIEIFDFTTSGRGSPYSFVANVLDYNIEEDKFKF